MIILELKEFRKSLFSNLAQVFGCEEDPYVDTVLRIKGCDKTVLVVVYSAGCVKLYVCDPNENEKLLYTQQVKSRDFTNHIAYQMSIASTINYILSH